MATYRCYFLDDQDRIQLGENLECNDLEDAITTAHEMLVGRPHYHSVELWQGSLRVYTSRGHLYRHQCHIYEGAPSKTLKTMAAIIDQKLKGNVRCLYLNSPAMIAGLRSTLAALGIDVEHQLERGALILSSDQDHLAGGRFDPRAMLGMLETTLDQALEAGYLGLWASGDMSWELGPERDPQVILNYEWGLEEIFLRRPQLSGICQYHADTLPRDLMRYGLAAHRSAVVNQTLSRENPHYLRPWSEGKPSQALGALVDDLCVFTKAARS
jgi:hypothetical protein